MAGLFYYRNSANESDIEILTRDDPTEIRYSNQPVVNEGMLIAPTRNPPCHGSS